MMENSKFNDIPSQNIYIDTARYRTIKPTDGAAGKHLNPFEGCSEFIDLSGVHLYYTDDTNNDVVTLNFANCSNLVKTPYIYYNKQTREVHTRILFGGLKNLTDVNFENFSFRGGNPNVASYQNFQDCTALIHLKIATNTTEGFDANLDIRGCTSLDADTLKSTLLMIKSGSVQILDSTWKKVNGIDPTSSGDVDSGPVYDYFLAQRIACTVTKDASYTPVYSD